MLIISLAKAHRCEANVEFNLIKMGREDREGIEPAQSSGPF